MLTEDQIEKFRTDNPRGIVHVVGADDAWEVVVRRPEGKQLKRYKIEIHNDASAPIATENLFRGVCVYPPREAIDALLDDFPFIPEAVTAREEFKAFTGVMVKESGK